MCSTTSPVAIVTALKVTELVADTPVSIVKSIKTPTEIKGMLLANLRAALCHCKLLKWVEDNAGTGVTECDGSDQLAQYYASQQDYRGQSFETISSSGPSGSIVHYAPKRGLDRKIGNEMYLVDAGAHFTCGTTGTTVDI